MSLVVYDDGLAGPAVGPEPAAASLSELQAKAAIAQSSRLSQTIDLRQNRMVTISAALAVSSVSVLFGGLWLGHFSRTEAVRGIVAATHGFARLDAPKAGFIKQIYVKQGDQVTAGTPIYLLGMEVANSGGESAVLAETRTLTQTRANQVEEIARDDAFLRGSAEQKAALARDQKALFTAVDNQEKSVQDALTEARSKVQRARDLVKRGYATRDVLDSYERSQFDYERQLTEVKLKRVEYTRQDTEKQRELATFTAEKQSQRANAANQINSIDSRLAYLKTESALQVQAPAAGQVLAIAGKPGDSVGAGQFVAAVGDADAEPVVILDVPARATGLVKVGQRVVLKYDAFPYKTFGIQHGTVTAVSSAAIRAPATEGDSGLDPRPLSRQSMYRMEVRPDSDAIEAYGEKKKLTPGSTLSAEIIVERRRLIDWVLDPIRAMRGRV